MFLDKKTILISLTAFFILYADVQAAVFNINLSQQMYSPGEEISAVMEYSSSLATFKGYVLTDITAYSGEYPPAPQRHELDLKRGQIIRIPHEQKVTKNMPAGIYKLTALVFDRNDNLVAQNHKDFLIKDTEQAIIAELNICASKECLERRAVFIQGEKAYLRISSSAVSPLVSATITKPDKTEIRIDFEDGLAELASLDEGGYLVNVMLEKPGMASAILEGSFAVIKRQAEIKSASACNGDGKCTKKENIQNCPQDCTESKLNIGLIAISAAIIIIIIIASLLIYFRKKAANKIIINDNQGK